MKVEVARVPNSPYVIYGLCGSKATLNLNSVRGRDVRLVMSAVVAAWGRVLGAPQRGIMAHCVNTWTLGSAQVDSFHVGLPVFFSTATRFGAQRALSRYLCRHSTVWLTKSVYRSCTNKSGYLKLGVKLIFLAFHSQSTVKVISGRASSLNQK